MPFCVNCGSEYIASQAYCSQCGLATTVAVAPPVMQVADVHQENATGIFLSALFVGSWGIHQFLTGNISRGVAYVLGSTLGAFLIIPPFIVLILVMLDLFAIAKGDYYNRDRTVHYVAAPWMNVVAILYVILIPIIIILSILLFVFALFWQ